MRVILLVAVMVALTGCKRKSREASTQPDSPNPVATAADKQPSGTNAVPVVADKKGGPPSIQIPMGAERHFFLDNRQPIDDKYPLPQDMEKAKKLRADTIATTRKETLEVFNKGTNANAPWADAARKAMEAFARRNARTSLHSMGVEHQDFVEAIREAIAAGADDPLFHYWRFRFIDITPDGVWEAPPPATFTEGYREVLAQFPNNPYPPSVRIYIIWNAYRYLQLIGTVRKEEVATAETAFWKTFAELAALPGRDAQKRVFDIAKLVATLHVERGEGRVVGWKKVDKVLADAKAARWLRLTIEGDYLINAGWDARGIGFANTVTPDQWALFNERLEAAKDCLERSWKADATFAPTATDMVSVARALALPREEMETWFRRAMEADPDCLDACAQKAEYLTPKWHGTAQDRYDFVWQCYRTKNWHAHLPLLLDLTFSAGIPGFIAAPQYESFYRQQNYFPIMQCVYGEFLSEYPTDRWARTRYVAICVAADKAAFAAPHFEFLGDKPWTSVFPNRDVYEQFRAKALAAVPKQKFE